MRANIRGDDDGPRDSPRGVCRREGGGAARHEPQGTGRDRRVVVVVVVIVVEVSVVLVVVVAS